MDIAAETVVFERPKPKPVTSNRSKFKFEDVFQVHRVREWPEGLSLRREDMYEDRF